MSQKERIKASKEVIQALEKENPRSLIAIMVGKDKQIRVVHNVSSGDIGYVLHAIEVFKQGFYKKNFVGPKSRDKI